MQMRPGRNITDVSAPGEIHPMFLRQLSSSGSSFLPQSRPALCRAGFRSSGATSSYLPHFPAPHPWCSAQGFPPWPPRPPLPAARPVFSGRTSLPWIVNPGNLAGTWRSFYTSATLMTERPDREPPHKRRKSAEEKRNVGETEGRRGGAAGLKGGKKERRRLDSSPDGGPPPNQGWRDRSRGRGGREGAKVVSKENGRDKGAERTRTGDKHRHRKDNADRDETSNPRRSTDQEEGRKVPQPACAQTPQSKPVPGPNPWFKGRGAQETGGCGRDAGGQRTGLSSEPRSDTVPPNQSTVSGADRRPPPPVRGQEDVRPVKSLQRRWETPPHSAGAQPLGGSAAFDFSVMSYNILSQELLQDNAYLYRHCDPAVLHWSHRLPNLLAEIQQHDADILCLQEVQEDHYENQIKPALQALGYQCEYKKRTGGKPDGCAVIFKSSRLSLLSSNPVEFFRPGDTLLDRDNVGLVVLLQPNDAAARSNPSTFICVANTHLLYNPRRGDIKLAQLALLLAEIGRLARLPDGSTSPVVLCGDFNSTPWSPLYKFLTTGSLDYRGLQIGSVSGQEASPRGQRLLTSPIWSHGLGIDHRCQYKKKSAESSSSSPTVEGAISNLTVEDLAAKAAAAALNRAVIEHSLKLQSSYQHRLMPDGRPEITTCHSRTAITVDYILYTPEFLAPPSLPGGRGLHLLGRLSLVGWSELEEVNGLPNQHHSSDHLPLLVRFRWRC